MKANDPAMLAKCLALVDELDTSDDRVLAAQMMQTALRLAQDAPGRGDMRMLDRSLRELRYALKVFKSHRHQRKVSVFGSARTGPQDPDYQLAVDFARLSVEAGFMVITGAGPGIMHAGNVGAAQGQSFGLAIRLPFEQSTNESITGADRLIHFRYFFSRKVIFVKETHAIALFPGGFGTHDEGFEVLTLVQTGRCDPLPIVMMEKPGGTYWRTWDQFVRKELLGKGMISPEDLHLYFISQNAQEAVGHISRFYRNYQSLRYVRDTLVLRLRQAPDADELERLNAEFADVLQAGSRAGSGRIEVADAHVEPEAVLPDRPRLTLPFNRRSLGRLRQLIDALNALPSLPLLEPSAERVAAGEDVRERGLGEMAAEEDLKIVGPASKD